MKSRNLYLLVLALVMLSLLTIFCYPLMPKKQRVLYPSLNGIYTTDDRIRNGNTVAGFVEGSPKLWRCELKPSKKLTGFPFCTLGISLSHPTDDWAKGEDFSGFTTIRFNYSYTGPAKFLRVHFRVFDSEISNSEDPNSRKFTKLILRDPSTNIDESYLLTEFKVADWWIQAYSANTNQAKSTFNQVTSMGIDFGEPVPYGVHELTVHQIVLSGSYLSKERWYLIILLAWLAFILGWIMSQLRALYQKNLTHLTKINAMKSQAQHLRVQSESYRKQAYYDPLTGVLNRYGATEIIRSSFEWRNKSNTLALLMIDIDHFKAVNDSYGHAVGDSVLKEFGASLLEAVREGDIIARWGGEEFVVILPNIPKNALRALAEKLLHRIENITIQGYPELRPTASAGVSVATSSDTFEELLNRADKALYKAKRNGRNRCEYK